ncbi:hypothetical protein BJ508DRAFT_330983 [Ascobolus immersus RN42]|uniref:Uncharacterized protein n=1 Tax=Ascobolus immersus RN42 TaxID=1160509 RepID=A0A3N4HUA5_ASCIM|nr:hypothetical protein BJ508DRAFT_330983 [Ascobolus immersus RN42]
MTPRSSRYRQKTNRNSNQMSRSTDGHVNNQPMYGPHAYLMHAANGQAGIQGMGVGRGLARPVDSAPVETSASSKGMGDLVYTYETSQIHQRRVIASSPPLRGFVEGEIVDSCHSCDHHDGRDLEQLSHDQHTTMRGALPAAPANTTTAANHHERNTLRDVGHPTHALYEESSTTSSVFHTQHVNKPEAVDAKTSARGHVIHSNLHRGHVRGYGGNTNNTKGEANKPGHNESAQIRNSRINPVKGGILKPESTHRKAFDITTPSELVNRRYAGRKGRVHVAFQDQRQPSSGRKVCGIRKSSQKFTGVMDNSNTEENEHDAHTSMVYSMDGDAEYSECDSGSNDDVEANEGSQQVRTVASEDLSLVLHPSAPVGGHIGGRMSDFGKPKTMVSKRGRTSTSPDAGVSRKRIYDRASHTHKQTRMHEEESDGSSDYLMYDSDFQSSSSHRDLTERADFRGYCYYCEGEHAGEANVKYTDKDAYESRSNGAGFAPPHVGKSAKVELVCFSNRSRDGEQYKVGMVSVMGNRCGWVTNSNGMEDRMSGLLKGLLAGDHEISGRVTWMVERMDGKAKVWEGKVNWSCRSCPKRRQIQ